MDRLVDDPESAPLGEIDRALVGFAVRLTLRPTETTAADVAALRHLGLSDEAVLDLVQVTALFNYYNRLADGLGVEPEPEWETGHGSRE